jgi:SOS-response transcriptional repressor LexA
MLTKRQQQTLNFIEAFQREHGASPTLENLRIHFGLASRGTAHRYFRELENCGRIRRTAKRNIEVVPVAEQCEAA